MTRESEVTRLDKKQNKLTKEYGNTKIIRKQEKMYQKTTPKKLHWNASFLKNTFFFSVVEKE